MGNSNSVLGKLWDGVKSLVALTVFGAIAWYGYSLWDPVSPGASNSRQGAAFNCRKALADLATDYTCINSDSCSLTPDEQTQLKNREADIERHCN